MCGFFLLSVVFVVCFAVFGVFLQVPRFHRLERAVTRHNNSGYWPGLISCTKAVVAGRPLPGPVVDYNTYIITGPLLGLPYHPYCIHPLGLQHWPPNFSS